MKKRIITVTVVFGVLVFAAQAWLRSIYVVPILMYHSINPVSNQEYKALIVAPENFKRQMEFLKSNKYNVISLDKLADILNSKKKIPGKTVCITFDDGYEDNYKYAYPVLKRLNIPATIFVMTNSIDKKDYLTPAEVREMANNGIDPGSHTMAHFRLDGQDMQRAKGEIFESKKALEEITGQRVNFFCYPGGWFTRDVRQLVIDAGYKGAVATNPGRRYPKNDVYALKRLRISKQCNNLFVFWFETSGYYTWIKEHRARHYQDKPWKEY